MPGVRFGRSDVVSTLYVSLFLLLSGCDSQPAEPASVNAPASASPAPSTLRVALLHPGRENDRGWNQLAFEALESLAARPGVATKHALTPNRSNYQSDIRAFAAQGFDLVICHGGEFIKAARQVAPQFPKTHIVVTGIDEAGDGVATLDFRLWEATYLCGVLAAHVVPGGPAGLIGGEDFRTVRATLDAFANGARSVKSDYVTQMQYVGSWDDVAKAAQTARSLIDGYGAKVLFQNCDAAAFGVFQAARDSKLFAFGSNSNQNAVEPDVILASAVIDMAAAYGRIVEEIQGGKFVPRAIAHDLRSGGIRFVPNEKLREHWPAGAQGAIDAARTRIEKGELDVLRAP